MMKFLTTLSLLLITNFVIAQSMSESQLTKYLVQKEFSGAVLMHNGATESITATAGYKDQLEKVEILTEDRFKIASITKLFTAVLIMQLVDEGKLQLEDNIEKHLPSLDITNANKIQISHLLQHTSGLQNESKFSYLKPIPPLGYVEQFASKRALSKPGKSFNYNNVDYIILGLIIEEVTGISYTTNLQDRILDPLALGNTGLLKEKNDNSLTVQAFEKKKSGLKKEYSIHIENFWAAGSMYSTLKDLLTFSNALKTYQLLSESGKQVLFKSSAELGYAALGCWTFNSPFINGSPKVMERRGAILGSNSVIMTSLDGPETFIALSNTDQFNPDSFGNSEDMKEYLFKTLFNRKD